jgi:hypothetical protein
VNWVYIIQQLVIKGYEKNNLFNLRRIIIMSIVCQ